MSDTASRYSLPSGRSFGWSITLSVILILAGIAAILLPPVIGVGVTLFIGWLLIISAITHFVFAWKSHTAGSILWEALVGVVYLVAGAYLIFHPLAGLISLTLVLAIYLLVEGIFEIILAFIVVRGRGWILFDGIITVILSFLIWRTWPSSSVWVIGTLVGISMLFSGFSRLMYSIACRRMIQGVDTV